MTLSKTTTRRVRAAGTAAMWLGGWAAVYSVTAWLGADKTITAFHVAMITISVVLGATWIACRLTVLVSDLRRGPVVEDWRLHIVARDGDTVRTPAAAGDDEPTQAAAA